MEKEGVTKTASVHRNADNDIIIDEEGYITCETDSGLTFKIHSSEVDLNGPPIKCTVNDEEILILLRLIPRTVDTSSGIIAADVSNQENQQSHVARHNLETFSWNDANTKLFLSLYREMKELVASRKIKNFKEMWKRITDEMKNSGYDVTATQVENKWKTLERQYKKVISNNNKTGRGRITCSYEAELTEILGKRHKIVPLAVTGPEVGVMVRNVADPGASLNSAPILMPVSTTTVLPTSSNVGRREELEDVPVASPDECDAVAGPVPENTNNLIAIAKRRVATGTTAKALEQCQEEMKEYRKMLEKRQEEQNGFLTQILETYKEIRDRHENYITAMENHREKAIEQRKRRNDLIEERNNLLKKFLFSLKKNCDSK